LNVVAYYGDVETPRASTDAERKRLAKVREQLATLDAMKTR
jgi:hypothetical protein